MYKLLECLLIALDLRPEELLGQYHKGSMFVSSLLHYPEVPAQLIWSGEVVRNPAYSDFGTLTLLFQKNVGGLGIADMSSTDKTSSSAVEKSGQFVHVDPNTASILVNVGYLLMRWTNMRWKNTVHRVSEPPRSLSTDIAKGVGDLELIPERYSIAFFNQPSRDTLIQGPKKKYPLVTGAEFTKNAMRMYYSQTAEAKAQKAAPSTVSVEEIKGAGIVDGVGA